MEHLAEIREFLKKKSNSKAKESWRRFVSESEECYGVYLAEINKIVPKYASCDFKLVEELWRSSYLEEKILAAKILGRICKKDPEKTLKLVESFLNDISNWAVCDTLATQGIKAIAKIKQKEILELSRKLIKSKNPWKRRFGIVLLINFKKDRALRKEIEAILGQVEDDKEYYVKKAIDWIKRSLFN